MEDICFLFKLNTVVNIHNWMENMAFEVEQLRPVRWKVIIWLGMRIMMMIIMQMMMIMIMIIQGVMNGNYGCGPSENLI